MTDVHAITVTVLLSFIGNRLCSVPEDPETLREFPISSLPSFA